MRMTVARNVFPRYNRGKTLLRQEQARTSRDA
jgi:hypothetical protein